jgi:hypothetical protein
MPEIVLECKPDEALMKALGFPSKRITHQTSRGEVINYIKKNPTKITGVIDDDPGSAKPTYFSRFTIEATEKYRVESFVIRKSSTRLVVIKPRLEDWILLQAASCRLDVRDYYLPNNSKKLHEVINSNLPRFSDLIEEMLVRQCPGLLYLKSIVGKQR